MENPVDLAEDAALFDAMVADLTVQAERLGPRRLASIFFGGGTPSLMLPEGAARLIETAQRLFPTVDPVEITLEVGRTRMSLAELVDLDPAR